MMEFDYHPIRFLRIHSSKYDPKADIKTEVWHAEFEPDPMKAHQNTNIVATCGGNSVCFIDVDSGKVKQKYISNNSQEVFYCCTWLRIPVGSSLSIIALVAGSSHGKLHIICPSSCVTILEISVVESKKKKNTQSTMVNCFSVYKDSTNNEALLCGIGDGTILAIDLKCKTTKEEFTCECKTIGKFSLDDQLFQIAFCPVTLTILAACDQGLVGIHVPSHDALKNNNYTVTKYQLTKKYRKEENLADSVQILGNGLVSVKYALHGKIYIFDLKHAHETSKSDKPSTTIEFTPKYLLEWSDTDNYFMNIGASKTANLLACGDDKGMIWLYNIESLKSGASTTPKILAPTKKIEWPPVEDIHSDKKQRLKLSDIDDIVLDKVAIHSSGNYIVAVTNNNIVCLWKKSGIS